MHEIGLKHMLKDEVIRDIVASQFETLRDNIRDADPKNRIVPIIRLTELITFRVKFNKLEAFNSKKRYLKVRKERNLKSKPQKESV